MFGLNRWTEFDNVEMIYLVLEIAGEDYSHFRRNDLKVIL